MSKDNIDISYYVRRYIMFDSYEDKETSITIYFLIQLFLGKWQYEFPVESKAMRVT